jgi:NAD-specific glutamate dehydrogenase
MLLNNDMPFLVDSLTALFTSLGFSIHLVLHPILRSPATKGRGRQKSSKRIADLCRALAAAGRVHRCRAHPQIEGLPVACRSRCRGLGLHARPCPCTGRAIHQLKIHRQQRRGAKRFATCCYGWRATISCSSACRDYRVKGESLALDNATALGIYRLPAPSSKPRDRACAPTPSRTIRSACSKPPPSRWCTATRRWIWSCIKRVDAKGKFVGETRMLGLFTSTVYYRETQNIPFIRRKTARVLERAGFDLRSLGQNAQNDSRIPAARRAVPDG